MKDLLRKTWEIFRHYPILWLLYLVAELIGFCIYRLRKSTMTALLQWKPVSHSVLGGETGPHYSPFVMDHAVIINRFLIWGQGLLHEVLVVIAFFLIATLAIRVEEGQQPAIASGLTSLRSNFSRVLVLALKAYGLYWVMDIWLKMLPTTILGAENLLTSTRTTTALTVWGLLVNCVAAWILTPLFLRVLRSPDAEAVSSQAIQRARILVLLVVLLRFAISDAVEAAVRAQFLYTPIDRALYESIYWLAPILAATFPSVLLHIAEGILVAVRKQVPEGELDAEQGPYPSA